MGKLAQLVNAKKKILIHALIADKAFQEADRTYLLNLPLKSLEKLHEEHGRSSDQSK